MSWEDHVSEILDTKTVAAAAIVGRDDGTIFGVLNNAISEAEGEKAAEFLKKQGDIPFLVLGGDKYQLIRVYNEEEAYLISPDGGACLAASDTTIVIGIWKKGMKQTAGACNLEITKKAKELKEHDM